jgi:hypothetical protein
MNISIQTAALLVTLAVACAVPIVSTIILIILCRRAPLMKDQP